MSVGASATPSASFCAYSAAMSLLINSLPGPDSIGSAVRKVGGAPGQPYSMNRASYDLTRLRRNNLIARHPGRNLYTLTADGLAFAIFYTKVHNRMLRPLMATAAPQAPPPLRAALRTIERHVDDRLAHARLPSAAA